MVARFKCCKTKEALSYFCISCHAIFHASCANRLSSIVKLSNNRVYCSAACESEDNEHRNYDSYTTEINSLKHEIQDKEKHIIRLTKKAKDFEEDVFESEQSFIEEQNSFKDQLKNQKERMCTLQKEIVGAEEKNKNLQKQMDSYEQMTKDMQTEMTKLKNIHADMLKTISLLEETNNAYSRKIGELEERTKEDRCRLSENTEGNANDQQNILDDRDKQLRTEENVSLYDELFKQSRNSAKTSKKLLIVGDQLARNCARVLHNSMKSIGYIVEGIVKPNTEAANITSNIFTQTMDHGQSDYVRTNLLVCILFDEKKEGTGVRHGPPKMLRTSTRYFPEWPTIEPIYLYSTIQVVID
ncbi:unnamed protein product [Acanthoscelides obtectus]|uniref:Uncharacterized protein n=1 Tax=Acanthoscelides obtectus TaxID=200917 RepID=A0A9P0L8V1_ACAOB|nr:unnamed protein product [Acanthoscelides obtectus]CAK1636466.1 hypothetical protein AOBTE_LOCUS9858 [Acanthoscelides obtectus]